jgi:hypothetical protein
LEGVEGEAGAVEIDLVGVGTHRGDSCGSTGERAGQAWGRDRCLGRPEGQDRAAGHVRAGGL